MDRPHPTMQGRALLQYLRHRLAVVVELNHLTLELLSWNFLRYLESAIAGLLSLVSYVSHESVQLSVANPRFGHLKTRYKGIEKNSCTLDVCLTLANLTHVHLLPAGCVFRLSASPDPSWSLLAVHGAGQMPGWRLLHVLDGHPFPHADLERLRGWSPLTRYGALIIVSLGSPRSSKYPVLSFSTFIRISVS